VHLIHHHHFVSKKVTDAVKINWDAGVALTVVFNPFDVIIKGVKTLHQPARAGVLDLALSASVVDQLEFVDAEGNEIGHIGRGGITQAGVELDALPFGRVVAGGADDQAGNLVRGQHFGLVEHHRRGRFVARRKVNAEAVRQAGFRHPSGDLVGVAPCVITDDHPAPGTVLTTHKVRHVHVVKVIADGLHHLAGTPLG